MAGGSDVAMDSPVLPETNPVTGGLRRDGFRVGDELGDWLSTPRRRVPLHAPGSAHRPLEAFEFATELL